MSPMKSFLISVFLAAFVIGCGGIPLRSMPRLIKLQDDLLDMSPSEFMVAIQVDARMTPPPGAAPVLHLSIHPPETGAFEPIDKKLPMQFAVASANNLGLAPPPADRRWLIYSFSPESQSELALVQSAIKQLHTKQTGKRGGRIAVGIAQEGIAVRDPAFVNTRWESWLQTSRREGFFELWSGTVGELLKRAKSQRTSD